jgi:hypothetical protein
MSTMFSRKRRKYRDALGMFDSSVLEQRAADVAELINAKHSHGHEYINTLTVDILLHL